MPKTVKDKQGKLLRAYSPTHRSFIFLVILAQCFGMLPVSGIDRNNVNHLNFRWTSPKVFYSLVIMLMLLINCGFHAYRLCTTQITFGYMVTIGFYMSSMVTVGLFLQVAIKWPSAMKKWTEVDNAMTVYGFPKKLNRNLQIVACTVMIAAAIEHSFFLAFAILNGPHSQSTLEAFMLYQQGMFDHVFSYVPYSLWIGMPLQLLNLYATFAWNYMDVFVMLVSLSLAARFKQVVERLRAAVCERVKNELVWMTIREDYDRLNQLCRVVDDVVSNVLVLSFANNLFFILAQLFFSLEPNHNEDVVERVYFIYSFGFLLTRTVAVSLFASEVDSASKEPAKLLCSLPYSIDNVEVDRFLNQVKMDPSSLSGRGYFTVTKSLILSVAGAVVTYELIIIQFSKK